MKTLTVCVLFCLLSCAHSSKKMWQCEEWPALYREGKEVLLVADLIVQTYGWPVKAIIVGEHNGAWVVALEGSRSLVEVTPEFAVELRRCR